MGFRSKDLEDFLKQVRIDKLRLNGRAVGFKHTNFKSGMAYLASAGTCPQGTRGPYFAVVKHHPRLEVPSAEILARVRSNANNEQISNDTKLRELCAAYVERDVSVVGGDDRFLDLRSRNFPICGTHAALTCLMRTGKSTPIHRHGLAVWNRHWWGERKYWVVVEDTSRRCHARINDALVKFNKKGGGHIAHVIAALNAYNKNPSKGAARVQWNVILMGQDDECDGDLLLMLPGVWHFVLTCGAQLGAHGYITPRTGMKWLVRLILSFNQEPPMDWVIQFTGKQAADTPPTQRQDDHTATWQTYFQGCLEALPEMDAVGN